MIHASTSKRASERMDWTLLPVTLIARSWEWMNRMDGEENRISYPSSSIMASADSSPSWRRTWRRLRSQTPASLSLSLCLTHSTSFSCARSSFPPDPKVFGFLMSLASHANHMHVVSPMQTLILIFYVNVFDMFATSIGIRLRSFANSNLSMCNLRMSVESLVWETWIPSWIHMKYERGCSKSSCNSVHVIRRKFVHDIYPLWLVTRKCTTKIILVVNWRFLVAVFGQRVTTTFGC